MKTRFYLLFGFGFLLLQQLVLSQNPKGTSLLPEENKPGKITRAVIIGISEYDQQPKLEYAHKDAIAIYDYIRSTAGGNVDSSKITLLLNRKATAGKIWEALQELVDETKPGETVLIYFSGHGDLENKTVRQNGFLLASDAPGTCYFVGGTIGLNYLHDFLETLATKNKATVIMITDACKSGKLSGGMDGVKNTTAALAEQWANIIKVLSSQAGEISLEGLEWGNGAGVFTYYLLRGLEGFADRNNNKEITVSELFSYLNDHVPHDTKFTQNPYVVGNLTYKIAYVDSTTFAQLQKNEPPVETNLAYGARGNEEDLKNQLDPEVYSSYSDFQKCIQNNNLIYSYFKENSQNAVAIYSQLKDNPRAGLILPRLKRQLLAALQDKSQQVINTWFVGQDKPDSLSLYDVYYDTEAAFSLVDTTYILYDFLKGRYLLLKGLTTFDTSEAMKLFKDCTLLESDASFYAYYMMGHNLYQRRCFRRAIDYFDEATNRAPGFSSSSIMKSRCYSGLNDFGKAKQLLVMSLSEIEGKSGKENRGYAIALNDLAVISKSLGNYSDAVSLLINGLDILKRASGISNPDYATLVSNLGTIYDDLGKYDSAEVFYKEALGIRKNLFGENHASYALSLNNLSVLYMKTGNWAVAEPLNKEALEIYKSVFGESHPAYATSLNNLAGIYDDMGNYKAAEPYLLEVLEIRKKILGETHPDYATSLNNLAMLYKHTGKYTEAEPLYKEAIEIEKKVFGETHPDYATFLNNLACLYDDKGNYAEAEPSFKKVLEIRKKVLGETHPSYAMSLNNLAQLYTHLGKYTVAEPLYKEALEINKKVFGETHPTYAISLNNLGCLYSDLGNYTAAEPLYKQALEIIKKVQGETHPAFAGSLNNLANLYKDMGNYTAAEPLYKQALEIRKKVLSESHPDYAISLNNLASLYKSQGNYEAAEPLYQQALEIRKKVLGESHPDYASSLNNLASLYKSMGNYEVAEPLYQQALEIRKRVLGESHPDYAISLSNLAYFYNGSGKYKEAESLYMQTIKIDKKIYGANHKEVARDMESLASFYKDFGKYSNAVFYYDSSLLIDITDVESIYWRGKCKFFAGDTLGAKQDCEVYLNKSDNSLRKIYCLFYSGNRADALVKMEELAKNDTDNAFIYSLAAMYSLNDRSADALNYLEEALKRGYKNKQNILSDPNIKSLRELPEFKTLMEKYFRSSK